MWLQKYPSSKIGVTGLVTYPSSEVSRVVLNTRLDQMLLETDAPYFPVPGAERNIAVSFIFISFISVFKILYLKSNLNDKTSP